MSVIISEVVKDFVKYYKENPGWGLFHSLLDDGNFDQVGSITEWVSDEAPRNKFALKLANLLDGMKPWQLRRICDVVPRIARKEKIPAAGLDRAPSCDWCGGDVDDNGNCLLDYCKGNQ